MDARGAPKWIGQAHLANELADVQRNLRPASARPRSQAPIGPKGQTVPADHRVWRDNLQCRKRCRNQPRQPNEQHAIDVVEGRFLRRLAPEHIDLMAKNQDLGFTPCAGPEQPKDCAKKQSEQLNHRTRASPVSLLMTTQPLSPLTMPLSRHTRRREFITPEDPVRLGIVTSLARPGGTSGVLKFRAIGAFLQRPTRFLRAGTSNPRS
jgi:hypothetical protein